MKKLLLASILFLAMNGIVNAQTYFYTDYSGGCTPLNINFYTTGSPSNHFYWYFGDGSTLNDSYNASHTYQYEGNYTVYLDEYDAGWSYIGSYSVQINAMGQPNGLYQSAEVACPNDPVQFSIYANSNQFTWDFGDGNLETTSGGGVYHSYTTPGTYYLSVTFFSLDCYQYYTVADSIVIDGSLPFFSGFPGLQVDQPTLCPTESTTMHVNGSDYLSYSWDFGNGTFASGNYVTATYPTTGLFTASVTLLNGCGVDTTLFSLVDVNNSILPPTITIGGPTAVCPGDQVYFTSYGPPGLNFTWDFGDGSPIVQTDYNYVYHTFSTSGTYVITLTTENTCGNTSVSTYTVTGSPTAPLFDTYFQVQPNEVCPGDAVNYWVPWYYSYYVDFGDGTIMTDGNSHVYSNPGVYNVTAILQNVCGMTDTLYQTVQVQSNIGFAPGSLYAGANPMYACPGSNIEFYSQGGYTDYNWNFGDGFTGEFQQIEHAYLSGGNYAASVTVTNGCDYDTTLVVNVNIMTNLPVDNLEWVVYGDEVCPGNELFMAAEDFGELSINWDFGDGSANSSDVTTSHIYNSTGTYTVTLTATNGCGNDTTVTQVVDVNNTVFPDISIMEAEIQSPGCVGDNLYFAVFPAGLGIYSWDFGDGESGISDQLLVVESNPYMIGFHSYDTPGSYTAVLTVTNACGNSIDTSISVQINSFGSSSPVDIMFWWQEGTAFCEGQPVTFNAIGANTYIWDFGDGTGNLVTTGSLSPVEHIFAQDGSYNVSLIGFNACGGSDDSDELIFIPDSDIDVLTNAVQEAECGVNNGVAIVTATGGAQPYTYSWTNGDQGVIADSLSSGIYVVTVTDNNGCSTEGMLAVSDEEGPVILLENIVNNDCNGQDNGVISVSVLGGAPPYDILWSNGDNTQDIFNLEAGPYEIFVTDANGCFAAETFTVNEPAKSVVSVITQPSVCGGNTGEALATVSNGVTPFNFIWPNVTGASNTTSGLAGGVYDLMIIDGNTCLLQTTFEVNEENAAVIVVDSITDPTCSGDLSAIYISTIGGVAPFTYNWSNSSSNEDLTNVLPGEYTVEIEGSNNCSSFMHFNVEMSAPDQTSICMVTVDTLSHSNIVVWSPVPSSDVVSYNIYKESSQSGLYFLVANQSSDSISQYNDYDSDPAIRSWRYKVAAVDDCGNEAELSDPHKTIHLTSNMGISGEINLIWDHYNGFNYDTYYIWRYHPSTNWVKIDSIGSLNISYSDLTPPDDSNLVYVIEIIPPGTCTAQKVQDYNSSRSNKTSVNYMDPSDLNVTENDQAGFNMYPNPTSGLVKLNYSATINEVRIYDLSGQLVYRGTNAANTMSIDCSEFSRGVYSVQLFTDAGIIHSKLVKQ